MSLFALLLSPAPGCVSYDEENGLSSEAGSRSAAPEEPTQSRESGQSAAEPTAIPSGGGSGPTRSGEGQDTGPRGDACPCGPQDCLASDDDPCDGGTGLCADGVCQPTGTMEALPWHESGYWVSTVRATPSGGLVASAAERVGEADEAPEVRIFQGALEEVAHFPGATAVDLAAHEHGLFALAYAQERVELRHLAETEPREVWEDFGGPLRFSPDGTYLAMGTPEGVRLQPLDPGPEAPPAEPLDFEQPETRSARMWVLEFSADGGLLALGRGASGFGSPVGDIRVYDITSGERLRTFDCPATSGSFSPDASRFAAACWNSGDLFSVDAQRPAERLAAPDLAQGLHWLDVPGQGPLLLFGSFVGQVRLLQQVDEAWQVLAALPLPAVREAVALPDGRLLLAPWSDAGPYLWNPHFRSQETP